MSRCPTGPVRPDVLVVADVVDREGAYTPASSYPMLGCVSVAPLWPHFEQRARWRSTSLDAPAPHRMTNGAMGIG